MIVLTFTIKGPGVPKGRPRFTRQGRAYTPKATEDFEKWVRANAKQTMMRNGVRMIESGAVSIKIMFRFAPPASWSNKRRQTVIAARAPKITKPDLDNLVKAVTDAMNAVVYDDDNRIYSIEACKIYGPVDDIGIEIHSVTEEGVDDAD